MSTAVKQNIFGLTLQQLEKLTKDFGEKSFRGRQLFQWMYQKNIYDFQQMTNINASLRDRFSDKYNIILPKVIREQNDPDDGTRKFLIQLSDKEVVEMVLIPVRDRIALCMSSQVGCTIGCKFCATGFLGFKRNLTIGEMLGQLILGQGLAGKENLASVVMMGMGEPLLNLENVIDMIYTAASELGVGFSARKFTISTVGLIKGIKELTARNFRAGLALSLHAPIQELRERMIPTAKMNPLDELIPALKKYANQAGDRITLEYIMIAGITDTMECAKALADLSRELPCKINLIAYNPIIDEAGNLFAPVKTKGKSKVTAMRGKKAKLLKRLRPFTPYDFKTPSMDAINKFRDYLYPRCPAVTFRKAKGLKIAAACGQLAAQIKKSSEK